MNRLRGNTKQPSQGNGGFTLIEIILTLSIVGLIAVTFIPLLANSLSGIFLAGNRASSLYEAQADMEHLYSSSNAGSDSSVEIVCDSTAKTLTIDGKLKEVNKTVHGTSLHLYMFVPD